MSIYQSSQESPGFSRGECQEELGATRPEIKRALKGLAVIFKIAFALGYRVRISLEKIEGGKE